MAVADANAPGWHLSLYPAAGEAGGCFVPTIVPGRAYVARGRGADPARAALEAGRRARGRLRRYCAANGLNRLGTLTYAGTGCHEPLALRADLSAFFRELRLATPGSLPYVWVPEWHKSGHGLHAHFALGKFVQRSVIADAWGRGFVHIKLLGDVGVGAGALEQARRAAAYLSKYVAKTFTDPGARVSGLHRYDVAQGFQPEKVRLRDISADGVIAQASERFHSVPSRVWRSEGEPAWIGPPSIWAQWDGAL